MKKKKKFLESLGLFLHPKFEFHLLIEIMMNLLSIVPIIGIFELLNYPLVSYSGVAGVIIYIVVLTLVMESFKVYILRHFIDFLFKTKGLFLYFMYILFFYLTTFIVKDLSFRENKVINIFIFTTLFIFLKVMLIIVYQRNINKKEKGEDNETMD